MNCGGVSSHKCRVAKRRCGSEAGRGSVSRLMQICKELKWGRQAACFLLIPSRPQHQPKWSTWKLSPATCNYIDVQLLPLEAQLLTSPQSPSRNFVLA